jgi:septal ring factor EnvC (AmiA/AmiB activator)
LNICCGFIRRNCQTSQLFHKKQILCHVPGDGNSVSRLLIEVMLFLFQATANVQDLAKRLKQSEHTVGELQRQNDESGSQLQNALAENQRLAAELTRSRIVIKELEEKVDALARENKQLSGQLQSLVLFVYWVVTTAVCCIKRAAEEMMRRS